MDKFSRLFGRARGAIIGMVHLRALPGSPQSCSSMQEITDVAGKEAEIYREANLDAIMVENMHDTPWLPTEQLGPETTASMATICANLRRENPHIPMGVQVLSAGNRQAMAIARAAGFNYIRAEGFVFSHIGDEGPTHSCAADLIRYRRHIAADDILVFTDIKKKHCSHSITSDVSLEETAKAAELFLSDGVIVTGTSTGEPTDPTHVSGVQNAVNIPVLVGSGVTNDNLSSYLHANALIIGSHFKRGGRWNEEIERERVLRFMETVHRLRDRGS